MHKLYIVWALVLAISLVQLGCKKNVSHQGSSNYDAAVEQSIVEVEPSDNLDASESTDELEDSKTTKVTDDPVINEEVTNEQSEKKQPSAIKKKRPPVRKKKKYAKMTFDSVIHHLPSIIEGDNFKYKFQFRNTGDIPLSIKSADASCGCTMPSYPFVDIAPGDKGTIGVDYFSVNKDGAQVAEITLKANTYPSETTLKMLFDVTPRPEEGSETKDSLSN